MARLPPVAPNFGCPSSATLGKRGKKPLAQCPHWSGMSLVPTPKRHTVIGQAWVTWPCVAPRSDWGLRAAGETQWSLIAKEAGTHIVIKGDSLSPQHKQSEGRGFYLLFHCWVPSAYNSQCLAHSRYSINVWQMHKYKICSSGPRKRSRMVVLIF